MTRQVPNGGKTPRNELGKFRSKDPGETEEKRQSSVARKKEGGRRD